MSTTKGSDACPGILGFRVFCVPRMGQYWGSLFLPGRCGTMCTFKVSDVRPGVPWTPRLLRGRCGTTLGFTAFAWQACDNVRCQGVGCMPWRSSGSASFTWQAWDNVHCQGVGCMPWRPSGSSFFIWQLWQSFTHSLIHLPTHSRRMDGWIGGRRIRSLGG